MEHCADSMSDPSCKIKIIKKEVILKLAGPYVIHNNNDNVHLSHAHQCPQIPCTAQIATLLVLMNTLTFGAFTLPQTNKDCLTGLTCQCWLCRRSCCLWGEHWPSWDTSHSHGAVSLPSGCDRWWTQECELSTVSTGTWTLNTEMWTFHSEHRNMDNEHRDVDNEHRNVTFQQWAQEHEQWTQECDLLIVSTGTGTINTKMWPFDSEHRNMDNEHRNVNNELRNVNFQQ